MHIYCIADAKAVTLLLLKPEAEGDRAVNTYAGKLNKKDVSAWIDKALAPAIVTLDQ